MTEKTILLKNALIIDGSNRAANPNKGDLLIKGEMIAQVGNLKYDADETIDLSGLCLAPGFIDIHSHTDYQVFINPVAEYSLRQGVTTCVCGNCGFSAFPSAKTAMAVSGVSVGIPIISEEWENAVEYFQEMAKHPCTFNIAALVGAGVLRAQAMGFADRAPSASELSKMKGLLNESLSAGAWGFSSGLIYSPGISAETEELVELSKVAASHGAIYATHMRGVGKNGLKEALEIAEKSDVSLLVSHYKEKDLVETQEMIARARTKGIRIHYDVYPYKAPSTGLVSLLPRKFSSHGPDRLRSVLKDLSCHNEIKKIAQDNKSKVVCSCTATVEFLGLSLEEIAAKRNEAIEETFLWLLLENDFRVQIRYVGKDDELLDRATIANPIAMIGSDGLFWKSPGEPDCSHPRSHGAFPRILGRYVREQKMLSLEKAIHKMSGLPAAKLGLNKRGEIKAGNFADLVVFDKEKIADRATYANPHEFAVGIEHVFVNGRPVIRSNNLTGKMPGKILRRKTK